MLENTKGNSSSLLSLRPSGVLQWLLWLETVAMWEAVWRWQQQNGTAKTLRTVLQTSEFNRHTYVILGKNKERYRSVNILSALSLLSFLLTTFYGFVEFYKIVKGWSKWNFCGSLHQLRAIPPAGFSQVIAFDFTAVNRVLSLHITYHYAHSWVWCFEGD